MNKFLQNMSHYGDILAIPFFLLLVIYFYNIPNKSLFEYILFMFAIAGFVLDIIYTYLFFRKNKSFANFYVMFFA